MAPLLLYNFKLWRRIMRKCLAIKGPRHYFILVGVLICYCSIIYGKQTNVNTAGNRVGGVVVCCQIEESDYAGDFNNLKLYYSQLLEAAREKKNPREEIVALRSLAYTYSIRKNDYDRANYYLNKALKIAETSSDKLSEAYILNDLGKLHKSKGAHIKASEYLFIANKKAEFLKDKLLLTRTWYSLGEVYDERKEYKEALEYFRKALPFTKEKQFKKMRGIILKSIGRVNYFLGSQKEAQADFQEAIDIFEELNDANLLAETQISIGKGEVEINRYTKAEYHFQTALRLNASLNNRNREVLILSSLANLYLKAKRYEEAHLTALKGLRILQTVDTKLYKDELAKLLSATYDYFGSYEKAFYYSELSTTAKDELDLAAANEKWTKMMALYEKEKAISDMEQLRVNNIEKEERLSRLKFSITIAIILGLIGILLAFLLYRRIRSNYLRRYKQLRMQLTEDLHDNVSSSLNHIKMMANRLNSNRINEQQKKQHVQQIKIISNEVVGNMYDLIWSLDDNKQTIADLISKMRDYVSNVFTINGISYQIKEDITNKNTILSATVKNNIYAIFKEAVNNVIKHTEPGKVDISFSIEDNHFILNIINDTYKIKQVERSSEIGLRSIRRRAVAMLGRVEITKENNLFTVNLRVPI